MKTNDFPNKLTVIFGLVFLLFAHSAYSQGTIIRIDKENVTIGIGEDQGVKPDFTGQIYFQVDAAGGQKIDKKVAEFKVFFVSSAFCVVHLKQKTAKVKLGYLARFNQPLTKPTITFLKKHNAPQIPGMSYIPAGEFLMGSPYYSDEKPLHKVSVAAFYIDRYEVTNDQYKKCVNMGGCKQPDYRDKINFSRGNQPVVGINWTGAQKYCQWAKKRLPTEAEWEKAAKGKDLTTYPWGTDKPTCETANYGKCKPNPDPVGTNQKDKSSYDVYDMAGNVSEWVADWYDENYYEKSPKENPQGPVKSEFKVFRGCNWFFSKSCLRTTYRNKDMPDNGTNYIGFRCAKDAK